MGIANLWQPAASAERSTSSESASGAEASSASASSAAASSSGSGSGLGCGLGTSAALRSFDAGLLGLDGAFALDALVAPALAAAAPLALALGFADSSTRTWLGLG